MTYLAHQQRVVDEQHELADRINKLSTFLVGETFKALGNAEQSRLRRQRTAMEAYDQVLLERIAAFDTN